MTTKNETRTPQVERPKFLVSIVERGKGKAIINLYNKEGVNYHYQTIGHGTATSEIMDILGLDSKDKDIVISVSTRSMIDMLVYKMSDELRGAVDTRGILFDLPVTGITNLIATALNIQLGVPADKRSQHTSTQAVYSAQLDDNNGKEVEKTMSSDQNYSLVLISVNQGYTENVLDTARDLGARGGHPKFYHGSDQHPVWHEFQSAGRCPEHESRSLRSYLKIVIFLEKQLILCIIRVVCLTLNYSKIEVL